MEERGEANSNTILIVNKMYYPEIGGVETVARILAETIVKANIGRPIVLTFNKEKKYHEEIVNSVKVTRLPCVLRWRSIRISPYYKKTFLRKVRNAKKVIFNFPSGQPELCSNFYKVLPCERICFYHADVSYSFFGRMYNIFLVKRFLKAMDKIIVTSSNIMESSRILKNYKEKIVVIPLFVDTSHFHPRNPNKREYLLSLFPKPPEKIVLYIGRLARYKGLEYLIEAIKKLSSEKYGLVIIGNGPREKKLRLLVKKLELEERIIFLNHVPYEKLPEYYSAADVFVLPSISRAEAFGLVGLEALACGVPIITTELGTGTSYYNIHGETGLVIPPKDSKTLATAVEEICGNNWKNSQKGVIANQVEKFSLERFELLIMEELR